MQNPDETTRPNLLLQLLILPFGMRTPPTHHYPASCSDPGHVTRLSALLLSPLSAGGIIASPAGLAIEYVPLLGTMVAPNALASCPKTGSTQHDIGPRCVCCWWKTPAPSIDSRRSASQRDPICPWLGGRSSLEA
ncbi:hypothetical protein LX32DRAFT_217877 [Colletotrichum zoysiae]|uniref:Uncharacterized protein n=1 Tax=Colletotrichum zoysiae TaxID=1216348 RepID=A0AAD9M2V4_9PEZI|nr:hypothetical protein LX32DRAFT_217877 [Colletotrichum zoysiae]